MARETEFMVDTVKNAELSFLGGTANGAGAGGASTWLIERRKIHSNL